MTKDLSRRQFPHRTAGAAGALAASPAIFLEPEHIPLPLQSTPPSDRLRFGIIGIGMQGSGLLRDAIQLPGVECVAACDLYDGRHRPAREFAGPKIPATRRYKDLLDNKEIDCLIAAVPDHWHRQVVVDAVSAGKDIYCEKPMSHSAADGVAMVAAAKKTGRVVQIGSQRVSSVLCAKAKELLSSGILGTLTLVEGSLGRILRFKDGRNMPDVHATLFDYGQGRAPVYLRLNLGCDTPEIYRFQGSKGILEVTEYTITYFPQSGEDESPSYYTSGYPHALREAYLKKWHEEHNPKPGKEPVTEGFSYRGASWDEEKPHLWRFFQGVKNHQQVTEDAVFGHHAALACHMANESYFRKAAVTWDAATNTIKS